jgi:hypothetical protein
MEEPQVLPDEIGVFQMSSVHAAQAQYVVAKLRLRGNDSAIDSPCLDVDPNSRTEPQTTAAAKPIDKATRGVFFMVSCNDGWRVF